MIFVSCRRGNALSRPNKSNFPSLPERVQDYTLSRDLKRNIPDEEIEISCIIKHDKPTTIELISHLVGGPNMEYTVIEKSNSYECFFVLKKRMVDEMKESDDLLYFEDKNTGDANIIVGLVKYKGSRGVRPKIVLKALIRFTLDVRPPVGFCRLFDIPGTFISLLKSTLPKKSCFPK